MRNLQKVLHLEKIYYYNILFWLALCLLEITKTYSFTILFEYEFTADKLVVWPLAQYLIYWALSYWIFEIYLRSRLFRLKKFLVFHIFSGLVFALFHKVLSDISSVLLHRLFFGQGSIDFSYVWEVKNTIFFGIPASWFVYWLVIIILLSLDYYKKFIDEHIRFLELENQLKSTQLANLKMQLQPHFLFNAFNTISMTIREKQNEKAVHMISNLSDMMRKSLTLETGQYVPLKDEVDLVKKYLMIEIERFNDRLMIHWEIDETLLDCYVPGLLLQPVVENAFKHGISKYPGPSRLEIKIYGDEVYLNIEIFNTGPSKNIFPEMARGTGIGMTNTINRLTQLYKSNFKVKITEKKAGLSVLLSIPLMHRMPNNR